MLHLYLFYSTFVHVCAGILLRYTYAPFISQSCVSSGLTRIYSMYNLNLCIYPSHRLCDNVPYLFYFISEQKNAVFSGLGIPFFAWGF